MLQYFCFVKTKISSLPLAFCVRFLGCVFLNKWSLMVDGINTQFLNVCLTLQNVYGLDFVFGLVSGKKGRIPGIY